MRYAARWRSRVALGVPAALALLLLVVPLVALLLRADWARIPSDLATPTVLPALRLSLTTTSVTAVLCLLLGTPLAWFLARSDHRGHELGAGAAHRAPRPAAGRRRRARCS